MDRQMRLLLTFSDSVHSSLQAIRDVGRCILYLSSMYIWILKITS